MSLGQTDREDAFTLGSRLKAELAETRAVARENALGKHSMGKEREERMRFAEALYHARYDGLSFDEVFQQPEGRTPEETLRRLCFTICDADYEDVLKAWDDFLG